MSSATQPLSDALITALRANAAVATAVGSRIFETVPPNEITPAIAINGIYATQFDTDTTEGEQLEVQISVFTRGERARVDAQQIGALVKAALHRAALTVAGHTLISCHYLGGLIIRDDDTPQQGGAHGISRFEVLVNKV